MLVFLNMNFPKTGVPCYCGCTRAGQNAKASRLRRLIICLGMQANLYQKKLDEQQAELDKIRGEQKEIGWGSQIRTMCSIHTPSHG